MLAVVVEAQLVRDDVGESDETHTYTPQGAAGMYMYVCGPGIIKLYRERCGWV